MSETVIYPIDNPPGTTNATQFYGPITDDDCDCEECPECSHDHFYIGLIGMAILLVISLLTGKCNSDKIVANQTVILDRLVLISEDVAYARNYNSNAANSLTNLANDTNNMHKEIHYLINKANGGNAKRIILTCNTGTGECAQQVEK